MSCNKISQIFCLSHLRKTLKSLNLSHNRLVSLQPLAEMAEESVLKELDLTDNYIGELGQVKILSPFRFLQDLSFRKVPDPAKGNNPICDFQNYDTSIKMFCSRLVNLDGIKIGETRDFMSPNSSISAIRQQSPVKLENQMILAQKDAIIDGLHNELK